MGLQLPSRQPVNVLQAQEEEEDEEEDNLSAEERDVLQAKVRPCRLCGSGRPHVGLFQN